MACDSDNSSESTLCSNCGCPAHATLREIERFRAVDARPVFISMDETPRASYPFIGHAFLALATGIVICLCAGLLLFERPSEVFATGSWINKPTTKYALGLLTGALSIGSTLYLKRSPWLSKHTRIILVAMAPGLVALICLLGAISLLVHPIGF